MNAWATDHQNDLKQNKENYLSPLGFYIKNKFKVNKNIRIENDRISAVKIFWSKDFD